MNEWLLGCRPRADCCLASLSQAGRITSFSREPRMLCGTEKRQQRSMKAVPPSLHPSILGWSCFWPWPPSPPSFPLSPSIAPTQRQSLSCQLRPSLSLLPQPCQPAGQLAQDFQYQLGRERPRSTDRGHLAGYNF